MIGVTIIDGVLRVQAKHRLRNTPANWSPDRVGKLAQLIADYIKAAEYVDAYEATHEENTYEATRDRPAQSSVRV